MISKKHFILGMIIGIVLITATVASFPDRKLHLVFCDVGQGDASYIRTPNEMDMLIDGGPDNQVLTCLGRNMPFYDRTIDMVVLTHPQKDHLNGLIPVLERYTVKYFVIGMEGNDSPEYDKLVALIRQKQIPIRNLFAGDSFNLGNVRFEVLWPERKWVESRIRNYEELDTNNLNILGISTDEDLNEFSYHLLLKYRDFSVLFTGDGDSKIQPEVLTVQNLLPVSILKVPHHGSKTSLSPQFLDFLKPQTAIISVGRNSFGHPSKEAIELLSNRAIMIRRTDREGDIEIVQ